MRALLAVAVLLLAGCSSESPPTEARLPQAQVTVDEARDDEAPAPRLRLLADVNRSYTNPTPPPGPESSGQEWVVAEVELADGHHNLTFEFMRSHVSFNFWEPACRLYKDDLMLAEDAFSDSGLGQTVSQGTCLLQLDALAPGTYHAVYVDDGLQPLGTHEVRLRATGWFADSADSTA